MGIIFDSLITRRTEQNEQRLQGLQIPRSDEHPLLVSIESPVNRFCDDFVSSLNEEAQKCAKNSDDRICVQDPLSIDGFTITKMIGHGAEAFVYKAIDDSTHQEVAIKVYKRVEHIGKNGSPREVEISQVLDHPNLLKFIDCFEMQKSFVTIMPLAAHGAFKNSDSPEITVSMAIELLDQMGSALEYMHSKNVIHHDIKPGNILICNDHFVLCDFSVSVILNDENQQLNDRYGTSFFMAPEISRNAYSPKPTDMWSLGVTIYVLLYGKFPYNLSQLTEPSTLPDFMRVTDNVMQYKLTFPEWPKVPDELKGIISGLLNKDPDQRMTSKELASNQWIKEKIEEWNDLMKFISANGE